MSILHFSSAVCKKRGLLCCHAKFQLAYALAGCAGPTNGTAEKGQAPSLGVLFADDAEKMKRLGLPAGLVPYWQAEDPSDAWYAADKHARAVYTK